MNRVWILSLVGLASCDAHTPTQDVTHPSAGQTVPGASNPAECRDAPPSLPEPTYDPTLVDDALAGLDECTRKLRQAGSIAVSIIFDGDGAAEGVYVTRSTVHDCRVVDCVAQHLSKVRAPTTRRVSRSLHSFELALVPRERVRRTKDVHWPGVAESRYCTAPDDALGEFERGRLPPERIQSIIRDRYPAIRKCYEDGLATNRQLRGRVNTRFIIGRDGRVSDAYILENEVRDCRVARCVRDEIARSVFPEPESGVVTVVYPLVFEPG